MSKRPVSITIISWFLMIAGIITLISIVMSTRNAEVMNIMEKSKLPVTLQIIFSCVGGVIIGLSGLLILKGKKAGRNLYIGWTVLSLMISLFISPDKIMIIPGLVFSAVVIIFLLRPRALEFFNGSRL